MIERSTGGVYDRLAQSVVSARQRLQDTQIEAMNTMAEAIIEDGNMTPHIDEFALAVHGLTHYYSRSYRSSGHKELREYEKSEDAIMYDEIEKSVEGITGQIMMQERFRYDEPEFAMIPTNTALSNGHLIYYPLRFTLQKDNESYRGSISLPVVENSSYSPEPKPGYIPVARFSRQVNKTRPKELEVYDSLKKTWLIGKQAIVAAAIQDYSTDLKRDVQFLERLNASTTLLHEASEQLTEDSWHHIWADKYHSVSGGGD